MYVVAKHEISDPARFWAAAQEAAPNIPEGIKLHYVLPNTGGSAAVCLWEAGSLDAVRDLVESAVGEISRNEYYEVDSDNAMGLPQ
jgi:hypothetical protein